MGGINLFLQGLSVLVILSGFIIVHIAPSIVKKYKLNEKVKCEFEHEMTEEELIEYKRNRAVINIKMTGMLISLPGFVLLFIVFR
jgi:hypothetical protein